MGTQIVTATEFKVKCLSLIDEVAKSGGTITVTKRGQPMATLTPVVKKRKSSRGAWKGKVYIPDEVLMADRSELWDVVREKGKFTI
jgi:prevent-host-death family protein